MCEHCACFRRFRGAGGVVRLCGETMSGSAVGQETSRVRIQTVQCLIYKSYENQRIASVKMSPLLTRKIYNIDDSRFLVDREVV